MTNGGGSQRAEGGKEARAQKTELPGRKRRRRSPWP